MLRVRHEILFLQQSHGNFERRQHVQRNKWKRPHSHGTPSHKNIERRSSFRRLHDLSATFKQESGQGNATGHICPSRVSHGEICCSRCICFWCLEGIRNRFAATLTLVIEIRPTQQGSQCRKLPFPPRFGLQTSKSTFARENFASAVGESACRNSRFAY